MNMDEEGELTRIITTMVIDMVETDLTRGLIVFQGEVIDLEATQATSDRSVQ